MIFNILSVATVKTKHYSKLSNNKSTSSRTYCYSDILRLAKAKCNDMGSDMDDIGNDIANVGSDSDILHYDASIL